MPAIQKIAPCLWFDHQAEEAAELYTSIFPNSRIVRVLRFSEAGREIHQKTPGSVMTVEYELDGHPFTALNGGPLFQFSEAISFQVVCDTQAEVDYFWDRLSEGGDPEARQCGWLKDRFGVSWQVVPAALFTMLADSDGERVRRTTEAMLQMEKLDLESLTRAFRGE